MNHSLESDLESAYSVQNGLNDLFIHFLNKILPVKNYIIFVCLFVSQTKHNLALKYSA